MRRRALLLLAAGVLAAAGGCLLVRPSGAGLSPGDEAPPFELLGSDGAVHRLSDSLGKRAVVIAFFPKAFTGG